MLVTGLLLVFMAEQVPVCHSLPWKFNVSPNRTSMFSFFVVVGVS